MERVAASFNFLEKHRHFAGAVEVLEVTDSSNTTHIYLRLRVGRSKIRLPRVGLGEVIEALTKAQQEAKSRYCKVVRAMNKE